MRWVKNFCRREVKTTKMHSKKVHWKASSVWKNEKCDDLTSVKVIGCGKEKINDLDSSGVSIISQLILFDYRSRCSRKVPHWRCEEAISVAGDDQTRFGYGIKYLLGWQIHHDRSAISHSHGSRVAFFHTFFHNFRRFYRVSTALIGNFTPKAKL